jgi:hypothetical protein
MGNSSSKYSIDDLLLKKRVDKEKEMFIGSTGSVIIYLSSIDDKTYHYNKATDKIYEINQIIWDGINISIELDYIIPIIKIEKKDNLYEISWNNITEVFVELEIKYYLLDIMFNKKEKDEFGKIHYYN